jgi:hypothetical protein
MKAQAGHSPQEAALNVASGAKPTRQALQVPTEFWPSVELMNVSHAVISADHAVNMAIIHRESKAILRNLCGE